MISFDRLYKDKLDDKITEEMYDRLFNRYTEKKKEVVQELDKYSESNDKYQKIGVNLFELSQRASEIYKKVKTDKKREILRLVFDKIEVDNRKIDFTYSKAFQILSEVVAATNRSKLIHFKKGIKKTFEQVNKPVLSEVFQF